MFRFEQREPWRAQAEQACLSQRLVQPSAYMALSSKIDGPGICGMDHPFKVSAFTNGSVGLTSKVTLACPIIPSIDTWLDEIVKPAAELYFGVQVVDLKAGSYSCRPRNNQRGAKLSEHAFGNALDIMAFVLTDGREVSVVKGWKSGDPREQDFLREAFVGACRYFTTVLAPGSDQFHYDHLHIDLARHDPRGERRICKPIIKFAARIDPDKGRAFAQAKIPQPPAADLPPIDMEEDVPEQDLAAALPGSSAPYVPSTPPRPSVGFLADLPPPAPYRPVQQPLAQTYAPLPLRRPAANEPLALNGLY
ncbi:extensin family protein [Microvirga terricola]|uniref:extensin-like domain-containing protein n=1 Tax=Microvirga terricola TaxID=2719797 RepID=UPI001FEF29FA|nr:extensin family protein [Microvirga terricola]